MHVIFISRYNAKIGIRILMGNDTLSSGPYLHDLKHRKEVLGLVLSLSDFDGLSSRMGLGLIITGNA